MLMVIQLYIRDVFIIKRDLAYFEKLWDQPDVNLDDIKKLWDFRAQEFNQHKQRAAGKKKIQNVIKFLQSNKMLQPASTVLDVCCGAGNYATAMAGVVKSVVGIDISPNMVDHARENAAQAGVSNVSFEASPWETLDLKAKGWEGQFDLVFASMCPGINNKASLLKMVAASRGWCFLSSFAQRQDQVKDALFRLLYGGRQQTDWNKKLYSIFNILWLLGYYPSICYHHNHWIQQWELERASQLFSMRVADGGELTVAQQGQVDRYLAQIAQDGIVQEQVTSRIAWLYWQV